MIPGSSKSLWKAVSAAKDIGISTIPNTMTFGNKIINEHERSDCFASFFEEKVRTITESVVIDPNVFNGSRKIHAGDLMFMGPGEVLSCMKSLKCKIINMKGPNKRCQT